MRADEIYPQLMKGAVGRPKTTKCREVDEVPVRRRRYTLTRRNVCV